MKNVSRLGAVWLFAAACTGQIEQGTSASKPSKPATPGTPSTPETPTNPAVPSTPTGPGTPPPDEPQLGGTRPLTCAPGTSVAAPARIWRLTRRQIDNTLQDLLGESMQAQSKLLPEVGKHGFLNDAFELRFREADVTLLREASRGIAENVVKQRLTSVFPCAADKLGDATCKRSFVTAFGERAFRRPLTADETTRYTALYDLGQGKGAGLGVQAVIEAMVQSPGFLFRSELGAGAGKTKLTPYETASALSYYLLDTMPDTALLNAAKNNQLATKQQIEDQARRLLALPKARPAVIEFYRQLLEYSSLDSAPKDPAVFPEWAATKNDAVRETELFVEDVLFANGSDRSLNTLFTGKFTFMNDKVAKLYDQSVTGATHQRRTLTDAHRMGVLTQPALLANLSVADRTSPVNRGRWVRERLLCQHINPPTFPVDMSVPALEPGLSRRKQLEVKTAPAACASCHTLINDLGFGFEHFDAVGKYRPEENGLPIDAAGIITDTRDINGSFDGPAALAPKLAGSAQVQECMALQLFRYAFGRAESESDSCAVKQIYDRFAGKNFDLTELAVAVVTSDAFLERQN